MDQSSTLDLALELEDLLGTLQRRYGQDKEVSAALIHSQSLVDSLEQEAVPVNVVAVPILGRMNVIAVAV